VYIIGDEKNGKVGSIKEALLDIEELLQYLNEACKGFQKPPETTLIFCRSHLYDKGYEYIKVEAVTSESIPFAVFFGRKEFKFYNISAMIHLLRKHLARIYEF